MYVMIKCHAVITQTIASIGIGFMFVNFEVPKLQNQTSLVFSNTMYTHRSSTDLQNNSHFENMGISSILSLLQQH